MSVPTLVIGWSHKYEEVLEMFGLSEWAFGHSALSAEHLLERFDALVADREAVDAKLREHLPTVKARSLAQADAIAELVRGAEAQPA